MVQYLEDTWDKKVNCIQSLVVTTGPQQQRRLTDMWTLATLANVPNSTVNSHVVNPIPFNLHYVLGKRSLTN